MAYKIVNGRVQTRALEFHVVDHCNLKCDHCCSFSPILKSWKVEPEAFEQDLAAVGKVVAPSFLKIVGGEPLLHPQLETLLEIATRLAVAPKISLTTNGFLIEKLSEKSWGYLGMLTVSLYPEPALPRKIIRLISEKAKQLNIPVSWKAQDKFNCLDRTERSSYEEAKATYNKCWIHHRCNSIKRGRFYSCTRPQYIQQFAPNPEIFEKDGISVSVGDSEALALLIKSHLEQTEPLNSCYLCNGGTAKLTTHRQLDSSQRTAKRNSLRVICSEP